MGTENAVMHAWTTGGPISAPFDTHPCLCRVDHAPPVPWTHRHHLWPLYEGGSDTADNSVYVCPATHDWTHVIWRTFTTEGGIISRRRDWPHLAYELAVQGWQKMAEAT